jgi:hypothetical protein
LFSEVPLRFLALWAAKHAFLSGSSLKTEVFRDAHIVEDGYGASIRHTYQINAPENNFPAGASGGEITETLKTHAALIPAVFRAELSGGEMAGTISGPPGAKTAAPFRTQYLQKIFLWHRSVSGCHTRKYGTAAGSLVLNPLLPTPRCCAAPALKEA